MCKRATCEGIRCTNNLYPKVTRCFGFEDHIFGLFKGSVVLMLWNPVLMKGVSLSEFSFDSLILAPKKKKKPLK
jgi:hypothetical protein